MTDFQRGTFQKFTVVRDFHLGKVGETVPAGTVLLFDGSDLDWNGVKHATPNLRGAINAGWLTPSSTKATKEVKATHTAAAIAAEKTKEQRKRKLIMPVEDEQRVVSTIGSSRIGQQDSAAAAKSPADVPSLRESAAIKKFGGGTPDDVGSEGVPVARIKSAIGRDPINVADPAQVRGVTDAIATSKARGAAPAPKAAKTATASKLVALPATGGNWDMGLHWKTRVNDALALKDSDPERFAEIKSIEVPSVQKRLA